jgi:integrase
MRPAVFDHKPLRSARYAGSANSIFAPASFDSSTSAHSMCASSCLRARGPNRLSRDHCSRSAAVAYLHINAKAVRVLRDRKLDAPESGNARVKAPRQVFAWALRKEIEGVTQNPAMAVEYLKGKPGGIHSWKVEEVEQFERKHEIGSTARLALALLLLTGQRKSDVILFGRQHVRSGGLRFTQVKNKRNKPITLELPILPALQKIIEASPTVERGIVLGHAITGVLHDFGLVFAGCSSAMMREFAA